jgi:hypothetical protein
VAAIVSVLAGVFVIFGLLFGTPPATARRVSS